MRSNRNIILLCFYLCITTFACTCEKDTSFKNVAFRTGITFSPGTDTVRTRDTVWMEMHVPQTFTDNFYQRNIRLPDSVQLHFYLKTGMLVKDSFPNGKAVQVVDSSGMASNERYFKLTKYTDGFRLKLGVVPQQRGVFYISMEEFNDIFPAYKERYELYRVHITNTDLHESLDIKTKEKWWEPVYFFYAE
jgi:hypothetical protein